MSEDLVEVRVRRITFEAETVNSYELVPLKQVELPIFTAGAHVDLHLGNGMIRSYSLLNDQQERGRYVVAVNKDTNGRGGSSFVHENVRVGDVLKISAPRNNFALNEDAAHTVLIAGGIGITPLLAMIRRLDVLGRSWKLFYAARSETSAAFLEDLRVLRPDAHADLQIDFDDQRDGRIFDIERIVRSAPADAHLYCCGPAAMLEAFEVATADRPPDTIHVEYFQSKEAPAVDGGFEVVLSRSKRTVLVEAGKTILDALIDADVPVNYSCSSGVCGTCETRVIEGTPDHRDQYLSKDEQAANNVIMVCCSGSRSARLVLDL
ncbi:PDR/VanB family oxidoreductase [Tardiphaga sp. 367_B4_N1_1]|jgi:vanillate O-demethylase ferredoxin subunit|uniref:PDR/VanB family oxidoreductase n=1 Tax=Tardiphaga sp. 367_B4_N1_1 TaxID=3240777 RepID=UPI003F299E9C